MKGVWCHEDLDEHAGHDARSPIRDLRLHLIYPHLTCLGSGKCKRGSKVIFQREREEVPGSYSVIILLIYCANQEDVEVYAGHIGLQPEQFTLRRPLKEYKEKQLAICLYDLSPLTPGDAFSIHTYVDTEAHQEDYFEISWDGSNIFHTWELRDEYGNKWPGPTKLLKEIDYIEFDSYYPNSRGKCPTK